MPPSFKYGSWGLFCSLLEQASRDVKKYIVLPVYFFLLIMWGFFLSSDIWDKTPCLSIRFGHDAAPSARRCSALFCKLAINNSYMEVICINFEEKDLFSEKEFLIFNKSESAHKQGPVIPTHQSCGNELKWVTGKR